MRWYADRINTAWLKTVPSIIEAGKWLVEAKASLPHGEFLPMVEGLMVGRHNAHCAPSEGISGRDKASCSMPFARAGKRASGAAITKAGTSNAARAWLGRLLVSPIRRELDSDRPF